MQKHNAAYEYVPEAVAVRFDEASLFTAVFGDFTPRDTCVL